MQMHLTGLAGAHPGWPGAQVNVEKYHEWIQLVAELTVSSLNSWQWASNSVFYLLGLWSRLVSSMPYLKGESPSLLETYVPKITEAYLTSRSAQATQCPRLLPPASLKASHPVTRPRCTLLICVEAFAPLPQQPGCNAVPPPGGCRLHCTGSMQLSIWRPQA